MRERASHRSILLSFGWLRTAIAATVAPCLAWVVLLSPPVHALDPKKHLTQYLHTSWRIQDGSIPKGMYSITQTADGFLWFSASAPEVYRFDGVRFGSEEFRLRVRDDGKGIDPAILDSQGREGHYGLPGMRERATLTGGKLAVCSEVDAGTEVELCIRATAAYATERSSSWWARKFATKA